MNEQAVAKATEAQAPAKTTEWEWETNLGNVKLSIDTVRRYFCAKANDQEIMHFLAVCKYHRLNPWLREVYLIKYQDGEAAQIVIGRDTHARRAEEHPQYGGDEGGIIVRKEDGTIDERQGEFFLEPEKLVGAWAKIYRKDRVAPIVHRVRLQDWDRGRAFWKSSPAHMIAKVARAQARREAFPSEYEGAYSEDEIEAGRGVLDKQPIAMPLSVAEAAAQQPDTESPADPTTPHTGQENVSGQAPSETTAGDIPSTEEQAAIRAQEQAEAQSDTAKPFGKVDRGAVWNAVLRKAKAEKKMASAVLRELTTRHNMSDLSDGEVIALAKQLGI